MLSSSVHNRYHTAVEAVEMSIYNYVTLISPAKRCGFGGVNKKKHVWGEELIFLNYWSTSDTLNPRLDGGDEKTSISKSFSLTTYIWLMHSMTFQTRESELFYVCVFLEFIKHDRIGVTILCYCIVANALTNNLVVITLWNNCRYDWDETRVGPIS